MSISFDFYCEFSSSIFFFAYLVLQYLLILPHLLFSSIYIALPTILSLLTNSPVSLTRLPFLSPHSLSLSLLPSCSLSLSLPFSYKYTYFFSIRQSFSVFLFTLTNVSCHLPLHSPTPSHHQPAFYLSSLPVHISVFILIFAPLPCLALLPNSNHRTLLLYLSFSPKPDLLSQEFVPKL